MKKYFEQLCNNSELLHNSNSFCYVVFVGLIIVGCLVGNMGDELLYRVLGGVLCVMGLLCGLLENLEED